MLEPAGLGAIPPRTDLFQSLALRLEGLFPPSGALHLSFLLRPHPEDGKMRYWSSDLNAWLPPLPPGEASSRGNSLPVLVVRTETDWRIQKSLSGGRPDPSGEILWRFPLAGQGDKNSGLPGKREEGPLLSDRTTPFFSSPPGGSLSAAEGSGPLPSGISPFFLPERCVLDIRWPASPEESGKEKSPDQKTVRPSSLAVPFRLEVGFSGGRSIVLGGIYEPDGRSLSLSARSSSGPLLSRWEQMRPEVAEDLSLVLNIRLADRRRGRGEGEE
ncbi:hypothetical protein LptCag_2461 [Leptospirillum ferriphilum]|uniref:Uncharacterized protein n=2 Tax=Leptospirillum TaxID=179 RepID=A0A094WHA9_9BACT|nr:MULTISPECIES: hypothetical protein [Leptospirillum]AKS22674.1 hypothetical protein ABH19_01250 [Leptospirillum sp. Group II 'CF-1']EDZ39604.1 MAG: Hypothetical protein CGL2_11277240 [Leptospirillum sp. Group II '5-way CG']EIJ76486.1 MAG: Hypothetical protein C75L2_00060003 [Leptospirillum sp. Group II 'C75']KGA95027.1 hypothetical protein LptCag_2461 [Leptospirillum ferriphilum]